MMPFLSAIYYLHLKMDNLVLKDINSLANSSVKPVN